MPAEIDRDPTNRVLGQRLLTRRRFLTLTGAGLATYGLVLPGLADAKKKKHHKKYHAKPTPTPNPDTLRGYAEAFGFFIGSHIPGWNTPQNLWPSMTSLGAREFNLEFVSPPPMVQPKETPEWNWLGPQVANAPLYGWATVSDVLIYGVGAQNLVPDWLTGYTDQDVGQFIHDGSRRVRK